jgi:glutathione peroxidase
MAANIFDFKVSDISGKDLKLEQYKGKVLLIVNTASECGLTPQYEGLENLYQQYRAKGLEVLGFPANEFGAQEPGSNAEIKDFCQMKFGIKFPMFAKIVVKGEGQHPLYKFMTETQPETIKTPQSKFEQQLVEYGEVRENPKDILWNFEKFLISRDGKIMGRYSPEMNPQDQILVQAIEKALA